MEYILVCITILVSVFMITFTNYKKIKLDELKLYESIDFDSKHELLNKIIDDEINDYEIRNIAHETDIYITEEMQREMINIVTVKVISRLTDSLKANIKLIYIINSKEDLINVVGTLVSMKVLLFCIDINKVKE